MVEASCDIGGKSKITVAEDGNKRSTISPDDIKQAVLDITNWTKEKAAGHALGGPADQAKVQALLTQFEIANHPIGFLFANHNGGSLWQDSFTGLSVEKIDETAANWNMQTLRLFPFAVDIDENVLCMKLDGSDHIVNFTDPQDFCDVEPGRQMTFGQVIEDVRDKLLTGKLIFEEGCGLMSVQ